MWSEVERLQKEAKAKAAIEKEKAKLIARKHEKEKAVAIEKEKILRKRMEKEQQEAEERRKKTERKRKRSLSCKKSTGQAPNFLQKETGVLANPERVSLDHDYAGGHSAPKNSRSAQKEQVIMQIFCFFFLLIYMLIKSYVSR